MDKALLIFRHEFLHTIKRTGFVVLTLALPLLALLAIGADPLLGWLEKRLRKGSVQ